MKSIETIKQYAYENNVPVIQEEGFEFLKEQILKNDCHSFLEIGTAIAHTAIQVAMLRKDMRVVTIERDPKMVAQARKNIQAFDLEDRIQLIEGDAREVEIQGEFDCIFIDAAKAQYIRFFNKYSPLLRENGIILTDNMNFHGLVDHPERTNNRHTKQLVRKIKDYHQFLEQLPDFQVEFYDKGDGIALVRRKQNA